MKRLAILDDNVELGDLLRCRPTIAFERFTA